MQTITATSASTIAWCLPYVDWLQMPEIPEAAYTSGARVKYATVCQLPHHQCKCAFPR